MSLPERVQVLYLSTPPSKASTTFGGLLGDCEDRVGNVELFSAYEHLHPARRLILVSRVLHRFISG